MGALVGAGVIFMIIAGAYVAGKNSCSISNLKYNQYIQTKIREKSDKDAETLRQLREELGVKVEGVEDAGGSNIVGCISDEQLRAIRQIK